MAKARLGDLLIKAGVITESQLRLALTQQRQHGGKLGEHLVRVNLVSEQQIAIAVASQLGLVYNDCSQPHASQFSALVPEKIADQLQCLPVRFDEATDTLHVAVADPLDDQVPMQLARLTGKHIELQVAAKGALRQAVKVAYADIEIHDEGTSEFQLVDVHGRHGALVKVEREDQGGGPDELPEASVLDLEAIVDDSGFGPMPGAPQPQRAQGPAQIPRRISPQAPAPQQQPQRAPPPPVAPQTQQQHDSGEEAMRIIWAVADILIEKGYLSRSELMAKLRGR
jgi:hypothetical protein